MTDDEKRQLVDAVITQLKEQGTDVSGARIETNTNSIGHVVAYDKQGNIVRAVPTAISSEKHGAHAYMNAYTEAGVYTINTIGGEDLPIGNQGAISARLTVLVTESDGNNVITQILNLNNNEGGEGNVYIRSCQNGEWKPWAKLQTNIEVGQVNTIDHFIDNGIYSGVLTDGTPTSVGTFYDTFVLIVINNYAVSIPTGNPQSISQLKYSLGLDGSISISTRKRDQYGYWNNWASLDEKTLVEEEKSRAQQAEKEIAAEQERAKKALADEVEKLKDGDTIVGQAREIHLRNGKTVTDSFLARTTAGGGTIGDGVATLKKIGGNIVKNLASIDQFSARYGTVTKGSIRHISRGSATSNFGIIRTMPLIANHVYYQKYIVLSPTSGNFRIYTGYDYDKISIDAYEWRIVSTRRVHRGDNYVILGAYDTNVSDFYATKSILIDLTEMFGAGNEPDQATCDKLFATMDALPQGLTIANPTEFKSIGFNQFNPDMVLEGKAIKTVDDEGNAIPPAIIDGDKTLAVIPCLPCKVGVGENNGYCIHGDFGDDIKVYLTPLNPMEVEGELYMHELTKDATTDTYVPLIKGYMLVEVPTTANLCAHFLWSEDCDKNAYEPYYESVVELPTIPEMSEYGLAGIQSSGTLVCDEIDFEKGVYRKKIGAVDMGSVPWYYSTNAQRFDITISGRKYADRNILLEGYTTIPLSGSENYKSSKVVFGNTVNDHIFIYDTAYTDAASFKAAMRGVILYYELAEPEEYPLPKIDNNYISSDYGVEQFDGGVPCNANNLYYMRSLAGETRNFLDRIYENTDNEKKDPTELADYIANNLGGRHIVQQTETTVEIAPNVLNLWGEVTNLDITLAEADATKVNEYMFQFTSGATATTLILSGTIQWASKPSIQPNKTYQVSIINNFGVIGEFGNE